MPTSAHPRTRRPSVIAAVGLLLAGCTGRGGGQLPPDGVLHEGGASFGFSFTCEDSGGLNPPTGQLRIQLSYTERGTPFLVSPFSIHGVVDELDRVLESAICIGQNPPPVGNELIFLGRYRSASTSAGDFFSIQLSSAATRTSILDPASVFYARAGVLSSGNLTVD